MKSVVIGGKYSMGKLIGKGSFGEIYEGYLVYLELTQWLIKKLRLKLYAI